MDDINIIAKQTGIEDTATIKQAYDRNNKSVADTIMSLMNYEYCNKMQVKPRTVFDNIREIVDSKEQVYYDLLKAQREEMVVCTETTST